jgi:nicotinamidase/pyrazinamidase
MQTFDLLIIDPQNDFMDIAGAALPVPGAQADMERLAHWLEQHVAQVQSITVTLDSHASVGIERTTFWLLPDGSAVAPFTVITAAEVQAGRFRPRNAAKAPEVLAYLQALEATAQRQLIVWPVHCVLGTWGHNIQTTLADRIAQWEMASGLICDKVLKGLNPMTEQYSAFRAEVPRADDARTGLNRALIDRLAAGTGTLLVAGEALSHCVAASVHDMLAQLPSARVAQTVLLTDCMSPVAGFEAAGEAFLEQARTRGVRTAAVSNLP